MTFDEYLNKFPNETKTRMQKLREAMRRISPEVEELFSYGVPACRLNKKQLCMERSQTTSGYIPDRKLLKDIRKTYPAMSYQKERLNFHLISHYQLI